MSATAGKKLAVRPVIVHADTIANRTPDRFPDSSVGGDVTWKTLLSQPDTPTDTFTVGVATCELGAGLKLHRHAQAEIYYVTAGRGLVIVDGEEHEVKKGSVVFIPGDAEHGIRCMGEEAVSWLYCFAVGGFREVVYRFSGDGGKDKTNSKL